MGDDLLVQVVSRLVSWSDGQRDNVFRLGGDEFAILIPGSGSLAEVDAAARRILSALAQPLRVAGMGLEIGASAGVALFPEQGRDSHELLRCADVALHRAKRTPGGVASYARELDEHTPERLAMLSELGKAIREGELVLHFQPKVALQYGFIEGFEALVRWRHPRLGLLAPGRFVPFAEATDVMQPLTSWVVKNALEQLTRWNRQLPRLTMAINLSMRNLLDRSCPDTLAEIVREVGVDPGVVEFELTETAIMADPETAMTALDRITASGSRLAIDDFGTGYSSLAYLKRLPVDVLKIDRSLHLRHGYRVAEPCHRPVDRAARAQSRPRCRGGGNRGARERPRAARDEVRPRPGLLLLPPRARGDRLRHIDRGGWLDVPV
ncbi:MAG: bifunctional diguanylate cyclase/phosphodiesterase [Holophagales bacterium]|nr:bifunctional diguanylate cyclase/phosphodiesterase [Holophagales bacterium]